MVCFTILSRFERSFILTGIILDESTPPAAQAPTTPVDAAGANTSTSEVVDRPDRQTQLLNAARDYIQRLSPELSVYKIIYVRVLKSPAPYVLEVECETKAG